MINDKMVTKEKFGDLSRPLGDQFTHPTIASWWTVWTQSRVGCGIKMGQGRYTAQISLPTTVVPSPLQHLNNGPRW